MSKEKRKEDNLPKEEVSVNNNINLSLNQNDLIELAIEEKLEQLEPLILNAQDDIILMDKELREKQQEIAKEYFEKKFSKPNAEMTMFLNAAKAIGAEVQMDFSFHEKDYDATGEVGCFKRSDMEYAEQAKVPATYFVKQTRNETVRFEKPRQLRVKISAANHGINLNYTININRFQSSKYESVTREVLGKIIKAKNDLYNNQLQYLQYKYGEKRIKAKIVKASLSKSKEGVAILDMLSKASTVKLLG